MGRTIYVTDRIHNQLSQIKTTKGVYLEGLANVLLLLAMSDENTLNQAVNIVKTLGVGGSQDLDNKLG